MLTIALLVFLPLQAWAGIGAAMVSVETGQEARATTAITVPADTLADLAVASATTGNGTGIDGGDGDIPADSRPSGDTAEPSSPASDFAEQLLPAAALRMVVHDARGTVPRYAGMTLPDPDLPRLPRPPRG